MPTGDFIWMDGKFVKWQDATVHVLTHTLHYGLGVFEGIRCYEGVDGNSYIFRLKEHIDRLYDSAHICEIKIPFKKEEIIKATKECLRKNKLKEGYIRPLVFIGDGPMGLYVENYPVRVAIACWAWGAYLGEEGLKNGIRAKVSSFTRHHPNVMMTKAKVSGNYVNSILAKKEAKHAGYDEAIMLDPEGYVSEASGENVFIIKNNRIKTTPLTTILPGITRDSIITIAKELGYEVNEERFTRDELYLADEVFFTGTAAEVTPVREVDDRKIGLGKPGPITLKIQKMFFDIVKGKSKKHKEWLEKV
ncbi:MAG: branched-chain amino acid transaminase [Proteobacteria bacterium]|nr:branched-chain amino acid transaminase [Pseudomonadota bacterium]